MPGAKREWPADKNVTVTGGSIATISALLAWHGVLARRPGLSMQVRDRQRRHDDRPSRDRGFFDLARALLYHYDSVSAVRGS
jgi:hypothetical protein